MWIESCGAKLVNMNLIDLVDLVPGNNNFHVEAFYAGQDNTVTLFIGTYEQCEGYMSELFRLLNAKKVEVSIQ